MCEKSMLLILMHGLGFAAKIADVGLARFMNSDHVTQMSVMGTLAWAAPEIMR